jgi:hypothetical protein
MPRDFERYLKAEQGWNPAAVNLRRRRSTFNRFLGPGPAIVSREPLAPTRPRALSEDDQYAARLLVRTIVRSPDKWSNDALLGGATRLA